MSIADPSALSVRSTADRPADPCRHPSTPQWLMSVGFLIAQGTRGMSSLSSFVHSRLAVCLLVERSCRRQHPRRGPSRKSGDRWCGAVDERVRRSKTARVPAKRDRARISSSRCSSLHGPGLRSSSNPTLLVTTSGANETARSCSCASRVIVRTWCTSCQPETCADGIRNADEIEIDCGSSCPTNC